MAEYEWNLTDLMKITKNKYNVFSCFSCGGGSTMGYKLSGYNVVGNCEIDKKINEVYIANHKPKYNYCIPIQQMNDLKDYPQELYNLDILDGSPPCSTFSLSGEREKNWGKSKKFREGQACQVLDNLFFEFIKLANKLRPKIIVAENVKGILMGNAKGYVNLIIKKLEEAGYRTQIFLLNSARMGVPQKRERVFFISTREDLNIPKLHLEFNEKIITYGEIKDTEYKPINKDTMLYQRWLRRSKRDNRVCDTVERTENGKISSYNMPYVKDDRVPNTLAAGGLFLRFDVPGSISDRDIKLIQTFPQDYNFLNQNVQYICGMSVPPVMMKKIAEQIKIQLLDKIK
ncbi:MAG: DNA cytosine methyltransferase [Clostridia bacterium]|nr:DNA cytosine methyltransferase [Clostridia bacterium]